VANIGKRKPQQTIDRECASVNYTESALAEAQFHSSLILSSQQSQNCMHLRYAFTGACIVRMHSRLHRCWMETLTNKSVSCFLHKSNKYRRYYVKKDKNVCWRCTNKACKARIETRDGTVEEFRFHCHVETIVDASATVLRIREKRQNMERQLLPMELNLIMDI